MLTPALSPREALLAEMGVAMREDGGTLGVFSPKKVGAGHSLGCPDVDRAGGPAALDRVSAPGRSAGSSWEQGERLQARGQAHPQPSLPCVEPRPCLLKVGCPYGLRTSERSLSCLRGGRGPETGGAWTPQEPVPLMGRAWLDTSWEPAALSEISSSRVWLSQQGPLFSHPGQLAHGPGPQVEQSTTPCSVAPMGRSMNIRGKVSA